MQPRIDLNLVVHPTAVTISGLSPVLIGIVWWLRRWFYSQRALSIGICPCCGVPLGVLLLGVHHKRISALRINLDLAVVLTSVFLTAYPFNWRSSSFCRCICWRPGWCRIPDELKPPAGSEQVRYYHLITTGLPALNKFGTTTR